VTLKRSITMKMTEEVVQKWLDETRQIAFVFDVSSVLEEEAAS
jgi:hypothetical protein